MIFRYFFCISSLMTSSIALGKENRSCPSTTTGHAILEAADRAAVVTPVQFLKMEKTPAEPNVWKFKSAVTLKPAKDPPRGLFSFFAKPSDTEGVELKTNDRFIIFSAKQDIDLSSIMKQFIIEGRTESVCIIQSNIYLDDFVKKAVGVEAGRDNACRIQIRNLEANPLINDALSFRCKNPELEKRRIEQLAIAYAKAKRYGNAVVALELVNGNLNANTLSIALTWANEWQDKDERSARRFVERLMSISRRDHFLATRQMAAMKDILEDKKRFKNLRDSDWFPDLVKNWVDGVAIK